jgi:hypothetical protein
MVRTTNRLLTKVYSANPAYKAMQIWRGGLMPNLGQHTPYGNVHVQIRKKNPIPYKKKVHVCKKKSSGYFGSLGHKRLKDKPRKKFTSYGSPHRTESGGLRKHQEKGTHRANWKLKHIRNPVLAKNFN